MTRPPLIVRVAGSPLPAFLLFLGYAAIVAGWYQDQIVWWVALATVGAAMRTLSAIGRVRRYKAWLAEWNAMGAKEEPARPPKEKRGGRHWLIALLLLLAIPACFTHLQVNEQWRGALILLWIAACIYLVGLVLRSITRRMTKRPKAQPKTEATTTPVEWMLDPATSSPSRFEAARKLPEYCTRLLDSSSVASHRNEAAS